MGRTASMMVALAGGIAISMQARITGSLKVALEESVLATAVAFCSGLVLMILVNLLTRRGRAAVGRMFTGAVTKRFPFVFIFTGLLGAYAVFGQSVTVDLLGVAVFSVTFVAGQMVASVRWTLLDGHRPDGSDWRHCGWWVRYWRWPEWDWPCPRGWARILQQQP